MDPRGSRTPSAAADQWVTVAIGLTDARANELALVLTARNVPFQRQPGPRGWELWVPVADAPAAAAELTLYAHENARQIGVRPLEEVGAGKAGVAWYGRLASAVTALQPQRPLDLAGRLQAPVLGLYGGKDDGIPLDTVEQMKAALAKGSAAAKRSQFHVYPDAPHAFHADYRPTFRAAEAQDGWKRCIAWFQQHGVA